MRQQSVGYFGFCKQLIYWLMLVLMLLSTCAFEWMYAAFGTVTLSSDVRVATLLFLHMLLFSGFQLFSGVLLDNRGSRVLLPMAAAYVFVGMVMQIFTNVQNFPIMGLISQIFFTFGASFNFIGIDYLSVGFFRASLVGTTVGIAQMAYGALYVLAWYLARYYAPFLTQNFTLLVWCVAVVQLLIFFVMLCVTSTPEAYKYCISDSRLQLVQILRHAWDVARRPMVLLVSLVAGMEFGIFFALAGVLFYKISANIGSIVSAYSWVGFAIGALFFASAPMLFKWKSLSILLATGLLQGVVLLLLALVIKSLPLGEVVSYLFYVSCVLAVLFGFFSGGHMAAFTEGVRIVEKKSITTFFSVLNGYMCVLAGLVLMGLTLLMQFAALLDLLVITSVATIAYYLFVGRGGRVCEAAT
ncbi:hypothetical protein [Anaplasma platys]|nr:hypothetical protein [Anaplasma platys]